jgi:hypothetical protein
LIAGPALTLLHYSEPENQRTFMHKILMLFGALFASAAMADQMQNITVVCGDVSAEYYNMGYDLSPDFTTQFVVLPQADVGKVLLAGRNCGLDRFDSETKFEVMLMTDKKHTLIRDFMGPFGIVSATIKVSNVTLEQLSEGVVLSGLPAALKSAEGGIGSISSARAPVGENLSVVIRKKVNLSY